MNNIVLLENDIKLFDGRIEFYLGDCDDIEDCNDISSYMLKSSDKREYINLKKCDDNTPFNHASEL